MSDKWISVDDWLPIPGYKVMIVISGNVQNSTAFLSSEHGIDYWELWGEDDLRVDVNEVSHWMPLPEPPEDTE